MTPLAQALMPQSGGSQVPGFAPGAPTPSVAPGQETIGNPEGTISGPNMGISRGMIGSTIGGMMGRGLAGALTGSAFGPIGTIAGLIGSAIGFGVANNSDDSGFGTPGFTGQSDPADASIGVSIGDSPSQSPGSTDASGNPSGPGPGDASGNPSGGGGSDSSGPGGPGGDASGNSFAMGGVVERHRLMGVDPPGKDDGYGALDEGEFVLSAEAVQKIGHENATKLNSGKFNKKALAKALMGKK